MKKEIIYSIFIIFLNLVHHHFTIAQCHLDDWKGLKALYESTDGDNWLENEGWEQVKGDEPPPDCNLMLLKGVNRNFDNEKRVMELVLVNNNLQGQIPTNISYITELAELNLTTNKLSGPIPTSIGNLTNLEELNLAFNNLTGSLPPEIGKLKNLKWLFLFFNEIEGTIPPEICNLESIIWLDLGFNQLSGTLPLEFGKFRRSFKLVLDGNELTGSIPPEMGDIPFHSGFSLVLNNNQLSGCYDGNLRKWCNRLTSPLYYQHVPISYGNNFDATWEQFCETGAGQCETINTCYARDWRALKGLYKKTGGDYWTNKAGWENLIANRDTAPDSCNLSDLYGIGINNIGRVDSINLLANNLTGKLPIELSYFNDMRYLFLNNNQLSGELHWEIGAYLDSLEMFSIACNQISGTIHEQFGFLPNLHTLCLNNNYLEGGIPDYFSSLENLQYLFLADNDFSGGINPIIGELLNLTHIDLSNNRFNDSIPTSFGQLKQLKSLKLHHNDLSGSIPEDLGDLPNLNQLSVHHNQLSGCYNAALLNLCNQLTSAGFRGNGSISEGNSFLIDWENFCESEICK